MKKTEVPVVRKQNKTKTKNQTPFISSLYSAKTSFPNGKGGMYLAEGLREGELWNEKFSRREESNMKAVHTKLLPDFSVVIKESNLIT